MPARDKIHEAVIRALEKQGWRVVSDPFVISIDKKSLFVDLMVRQPETQHTLLVEIKTFDSPSQVTALAAAIGKYIIYKHVIEVDEKAKTPLLLAIPNTTFQGFFNVAWVKSLVEKVGIQLLVVDVEAEEITQWT